jgi:hypothetical protein
MKKKVR